MITSIHYKNFKALRDTTLPLGRFTLIVGPNNSGKSTAMQAITVWKTHEAKTAREAYKNVVTVGIDKTDSVVEVSIYIDGKSKQGQPVKLISSFSWRSERGEGDSLWATPNVKSIDEELNPMYMVNTERTRNFLKSFQIFSFDANAIAEGYELEPEPILKANGANLSVVLDHLNNVAQERFEAINSEFSKWLPEFKRIRFETPKKGNRSILLETKEGHLIKARDLSQGTLIALAILTVTYFPNPPAIVCFEEPERGIHPRLLRDVRDAMYRLAYPEEFGEKREPVQVIATTHSPYLLDLYKDHPEEIVIANKDESGVHFERLSDKPNIEEFLQDAPLGDVWYSGVLGGVPTQI